MMGHYLNHLFRTPVEPAPLHEIGSEIRDYPQPFEWIAMSLWLGMGLFLFLCLGWSFLEVLGTAVIAFIASDDPWDRE